MVDRPSGRSRRLRGLSPMSPEPSPRRHRSNSTSGFQLVAIGASKIGSPFGVISSQDRHSTSRELERNTLVLYQLLF